MKIRFEDYSVSAKLRFVMMATASTTVILACAAVVLYDQITSEASMRKDLEVLARIFTGNSAAALTFNDAHAARELLSTLKAKNSITSGFVYAADGSVLARYSREGLPPRVAPLLSDRYSSRFENGRLLIFQPVMLNGQNLGTVCLESDLEELRSKRNRFAATLLVLLACTLVVAFIMSSWLQRIILRPIGHLAGVARKISQEKNYSIRAARHVNDELGQLTDTFNEMLTEIQQRDNELLSHRARLEVEVSSRTSELLRANTGLTEANSALRNSESSLARAQSIAQCGQWENDLTTGVIHWSPQAQKIFGMGLESGDSCADVFWNAVHPHDRAPLLDATMAAVTTKTALRIDHRIVRPDGCIRFIRENAEVECDDSGSPRRLVGVAQDITDYRLLEDQLRASQKMEAVGRLAGGIAHDFNNLLTVILGCSALSLDVLTENDTVRQLLTEVSKAGERAAGLTQQLLAFSRRQVVERKPIDVNDLIADTEKMLTRVIGEQITLSTELTPGLKRILADPNQFVQVLMNLAINARDAMEGGGELIIRTASVSLPEDQVQGRDTVLSGPHVIVSVCDTGCGIDPSIMGQIFEPFFTSKEPGKGTGLGLSTVYGIVRQHGGDIRLYSTVGRGTTFDVYWPAVECGDAPQGQPITVPAEGTGTVLLIEDEAGVRRLSQQILEMYGYRVLAAASGSDALLIAKRRKDDIEMIVMDMVMPGLCGRELAEQIEEICTGVPILFMSGYTADPVLQKRIEEERLPFLAKPFTPAALLRSLSMLRATVATRTTSVQLLAC